MFSSSSTRRPIATLLGAGVALSFAFGAALVTSVISAAPASAHAVLIQITPGNGAQLTTAPTQVVVKFDEPVSATFVTVVVTNTAGVGVAKGKATVQGATVTQALSPDIASGEYRIAFRVTSDDGHPVTGKSTFTLKLAPGTSPTTSAGTPSPSPTDPVQETPTPEGVPADQANGPTRFLTPIAGALGLLVIGAAGLMWDRRRR
jgi:methionine-rich copper-binding protein CopC